MGYLGGVTMVVLAGSIGNYLCHDKMKGVTKIACRLLLILAALTPVIGLVKNFASGGITLPDISPGEDAGIYEDVARDAFDEGIRLAIQSEWGIEKENIYVGTDGFDFENMRAERIYVTLMGKAALADNKAIKQYVEENFGGVCVVQIEIG